jgi:hypothetical protein
VGERLVRAHAFPFAANFPFSLLRNRASAPFAFSSLRIAEYNVAWGIRPFGRFPPAPIRHYFAKMTAGERRSACWRGRAPEVFTHRKQALVVSSSFARRSTRPPVRAATKRVAPG